MMTNPDSVIDPEKFQGRLRKKLIKVMILVGVLPLLLSMVIAYIQGHKSLQEVIGASFQALAYESANKTRFLMEEEIDRNKRLAKHPTLILTIQNYNRKYKNLTPEEVEVNNASNAKLWSEKAPAMDYVKNNSVSRILTSFLKSNDLFLESTRAMFVTDIHGILVASTSYYPHYLNSNQRFWKKAIEGEKGTNYVGKLHIDPKLEEQVFHLALPILRNGQNIGLLHRVYSAKGLLSQSIESITFGDTGHVMIINSAGVVMSCPILPTGFQLSDPVLVRTVTSSVAGWDKTLGNAHEVGKPESIIGHAPVFSTPFKNLSVEHQWFTFAWQSSEELFAPTQKLLLWISTAGVFSIVLILVIGSLAAQKIVEPIRKLQSAAIRIGRGEDVEPLNIKTGDEIESLTHEINTMNRMIQASFSGLETNVREKSDEVIYLKEYTESILMSVPDVLLIFDRDLKVEYVNSSFEKLMGVLGNQIVGQTLSQAKLKCSDSWSSIEKKLVIFSNGDSSSPETATKITSSPESESQDPLFQSETKGSHEDEIIFEFGEQYFITKFFKVILESEKKFKIGLLMREVTEEKLLQDQLTMSEKLAGLGTLAAGIAHEMNNPLFAIIGFTEGILDEKEPEKIKSFADKVLERAKHMSAVISNLSGLARSGGEVLPKEVDLNKLLDISLDIGGLDSYSNDIEVIKDYSELPKIMAKPEEIQQVFIHIIRNGVQAMEGKGKLFISSKHLDGVIQINIRDTGPGISQTHISKIFDPFFTTKEQGEGSGLGLNIVHKIVKRYEGEIDIQSSKGHGASFNITFPIKAFV